MIMQRLRSFVGAMMKFLAFAIVMGVLVAGSAAFVSTHPRSMMACTSDCG